MLAPLQFPSGAFPTFYVRWLCAFSSVGMFPHLTGLLSFPSAQSQMVLGTRAHGALMALACPCRHGQGSLVGAWGALEGCP